MNIQLCITPPAVISPTALPTKKAGTCVDCDFVLDIGLFFDGTGNKRSKDQPFNHPSKRIQA